MSELADLEVTPGAEETRIHLRGEVDLSNVAELTQRIEALVPNAARAVTLDLTGTTYLDSSGLRMIFRLVERLDARRQTLSLVVPAGSAVRGTLEIVGLPDVVPIRES